MGTQMKASGILIRALLAMPLLLVEIEPGAIGGSDGRTDIDGHQRELEQPHLGAAGGNDRGTIGLLLVSPPKLGQS
jgi:hypothetical protein